jgi:hypothetical protein
MGDTVGGGGGGKGKPYDVDVWHDPRVPAPVFSDTGDTSAAPAPDELDADDLDDEEDDEDARYARCGNDSVAPRILCAGGGDVDAMAPAPAHVCAGPTVTFSLVPQAAAAAGGGTAQGKADAPASSGNVKTVMASVSSGCVLGIERWCGRRGNHTRQSDCSRTEPSHQHTAHTGTERQTTLTFCVPKTTKKPMPHVADVMSATTFGRPWIASIARNTTVITTCAPKLTTRTRSETSSPRRSRCARLRRNNCSIQRETTSEAVSGRQQSAPTRGA